MAWRPGNRHDFKTHILRICVLPFATSWSSVTWIYDVFGCFFKVFLWWSRCPPFPKAPQQPVGEHCNCGEPTKPGAQSKACLANDTNFRQNPAMTLLLINEKYRNQSYLDTWKHLSLWLKRWCLLIYFFCLKFDDGTSTRVPVHSKMLGFAWWSFVGLTK